MQHNYYIDPKTKDFYFVGEINCDKCNEKISNRFILNNQWSKNKKPIFQNICFNCLPNLSKIRQIDERYLFNILKIVPKEIQAWIPTPPQIGNPKGYSSVFDPAIYEKTEAEIVDNTVYAGRTDLAIYVKENKLLTEKRIRELDSKVENINSFFENMAVTKK